jgi:hypothetical protein
MFSHDLKKKTWATTQFQPKSPNVIKTTTKMFPFHHQKTCGTT